MLGKIGSWFTTELGGWFLLVIMVVFCFLPESTATLMLSIQAIIVGVAVLVYQGGRETRDAKRDEAMHLKLDELLHGVDKADDRLAGIEEENG